MELTLTQFSIVVVAADHNPTILNPDFLKIQKIVPEDWVLAGPAITTPPFATVPYENGVSVSVEPSKLQVADNKASTPSQSDIVEVTDNYVKTVPHVKYTAVGINFNAIAEQDSPEQFLIDRFLRSGSWGTSESPLGSLGLKFVYPLPTGRFVLSLDSGSISRLNGKEKEQRSVLLFDANFHRDLKGNEPLSEQVGTYLKLVESDWKHCQTTIEKLFSE